MSFNDALSTALDVLYNTDGQSITYAGSSIEAINITYPKDAGRLDNPRRDLAEIEIRKSDVPAPAYRDEVIIDGTSWSVVGPGGGDDRLTWTLKLEKKRRPRFER